MNGCALVCVRKGEGKGGGWRGEAVGVDQGQCVCGVFVGV